MKNLQIDEMIDGQAFLLADHVCLQASGANFRGLSVRCLQALYDIVVALVFGKRQWKSPRYVGWECWIRPGVQQEVHNWQLTVPSSQPERGCSRLMIDGIDVDSCFDQKFGDGGILVVSRMVEECAPIPIARDKVPCLGSLARSYRPNLLAFRVHLCHYRVQVFPPNTAAYLWCPP